MFLHVCVFVCTLSLYTHILMRCIHLHLFTYIHIDVVHIYSRLVSFVYSHRLCTFPFFLTHAFVDVHMLIHVYAVYTLTASSWYAIHTYIF
jgi:hypothetical protein